MKASFWPSSSLRGSSTCTIRYPAQVSSDGSSEANGSRARPAAAADEADVVDGPAAALVDELGMVEKTGCDPVAASRFSHVTDVQGGCSEPAAEPVAEPAAEFWIGVMRCAHQLHRRLCSAALLRSALLCSIQRLRTDRCPNSSRYSFGLTPLKFQLSRGCTAKFAPHAAQPGCAPHESELAANWLEPPRALPPHSLPFFARHQTLAQTCRFPMLPTPRRRCRPPTAGAQVAKSTARTHHEGASASTTSRSGHYKMGNYDEARRFNTLLLEREPGNLQAQSLNQLIEKGVAREGYLGMALIGGAAAVASIAVAGLMRRGRR
ncbi:hypothetical protein L1887_57800 [Cichorium endivia]|nr:hypothetical protein L1887_57800 [Cichorium endivia]